MAYVEWDNKFSVGIGSMDRDHKKLFDLINALEIALGLGQPPDKLHAVIKELIAYTQYHFDKEEEIMKSNGYPGYSSQLKEHIGFIKKIKEVTSKFHGNEHTFSIDLKKFLADWLTEHILTSDKKYGEFLAGKGIQ